MLTELNELGRGGAGGGGGPAGACGGGGADDEAALNEPSELGECGSGEERSRGDVGAFIMRSELGIPVVEALLVPITFTLVG